MRFVIGFWLCLEMFFGDPAMADEAAIGKYDWGRIVSAEALTRMREKFQATKLPEGGAAQKCRVELDYSLQDPLLPGAQIYVSLDTIDRNRWLAYQGPVAASIDLVVPASQNGEQKDYNITVEAITADDIHATSWLSYGVFPIHCAAPRTVFRLLNDFDMEGTGGNLHVVQKAK